MIRTSFFTFLLVCLLPSVCMSTSHASQSLDANEQAIVAWSEANVEDAVGLLERLVNINSGTLNQQGVKDVGVVLLIFPLWRPIPMGLQGWVPMEREGIRRTNPSIWIQFRLQYKGQRFLFIGSAAEII